MTLSQLELIMFQINSIPGRFSWLKVHCQQWMQQDHQCQTFLNTSKKKKREQNISPLPPKKRLHKAEQTHPLQHSTAQLKELSKPPKSSLIHTISPVSNKDCWGSRKTGESNWTVSVRDINSCQRYHALGRKCVAGFSPIHQIPYPNLLFISKMVLTEESLEVHVLWWALLWK